MQAKPDNPDGWGIWRPPPAACLKNAACLSSWDGLSPRWRETATHILSGVRLVPSLLLDLVSTAHACAVEQVGSLLLEVVFLGDELCDQGIPAANLSTVAAFVRQAVGPQVIIWTNEGVSAFTRSATAPSHIGHVPADLDLISLDHYNSSHPEDEAAQTLEIYRKYVFPRLASTAQRVMLVPGLFGCRLGSGPQPSCKQTLAAQDAAQASKLSAYYKLALAEPKVAGLCPWHWFPEWGLAAHEPQYVLGASSFPRLRQTLATVGRAIIANRGARPFVSNETDGQGKKYACFRIPALQRVGKTILLFVEGRAGTPGYGFVCRDHGDVRIVLKRSTDEVRRSNNASKNSGMLQKAAMIQ